MGISSETERGIARGRLFLGICLALIPTGASFALVSNILIQLKQEFILTNYQVGQISGAAVWGMAVSLMVFGPLLEAYGLKNAARAAFGAHLLGTTLMISAVTKVGDPSAFWLLMTGAAILAMGNGMIEVTGNPLVAALYPDQKTVRLNWFHAFYPIGLVAGGLIGFVMANWGGRLAYWPFQLAVIYVPVLVYGSLLLPQAFPKTENAEVGLPVKEMFRYTLTHPAVLMMLVLMGISTAIEMGPMRWIPAVLESAGVHGILVLVWISGWMVLLRLLAGPFVERLSPPGMLVTASFLTGTGLVLFSFVESMWSALVVATIYAWGVAFFFPTMMGTLSERWPKTGSLGIVLMGGMAFLISGGVGVPLMGKVADGYLAQALNPAATVEYLERVEQRFPEHLARAEAATDAAQLGYRAGEVNDALTAVTAVLNEYRSTGQLPGDATANALRAVVATQVPNEPLIAEAGAILQPAEAYGGQMSFRYVAPGALILFVVFGIMYMGGRRRGGYRAVRLAEVARAASGD